MAWLTRLWLVWIALSSAGVTFASVPDTHSAVSLHAKYASLSERLLHNPFQRALSLDSTESSGELKGDIYARVDYPFAIVSKALNDPAHAMKLKVVAEGVETEEQSCILRMLSCDEMQGFLFSAAVPAELFATKFLSRSPPGDNS